ncbi:hypothetical protein [Salinibacter altiplanensis]|uniref:hypothetical protein n=1 Tax=Salinibacter altiplanensis TaxID=1803181 RepID=UPI000C9FDB96|nr:hypothetical protein [Salinibacter altiplanensis]
MSCPSWVPTGLFVLLTAALVPGPSPAQSPPDSLRAEARQDFHGPDQTGKDGPLAKAGLDLLLLYHEYRALRRDGEAPFSPSVDGARVADGHVTIDAVAKESAQELRADLTALGLKEAAVAGRVVSGRLPIEHVPALARVESLRGVVLPRAETQDGGSSRLRPEARNAAPEASSAPSLPSDETDPGAALFLGVALGTFLLTEA